MEMLNIVVSALTLLAVLCVVFRSKGNEKNTDHLAKMIADEAERTRRENGVTTLSQLNQLQSFATQLQNFSLNNDTKFEIVRTTLAEQLEKIRVENSQKLDEMNKTVNEKLHTALETRLKESFSVVGERLDAVHKGLGEMQKLAADVGGLQRVLSNVKTRGILGETQLSAMLEQVLAKSQYVEQANIGVGRETVDFAVKLPAKAEEGQFIFLPIDAKFPIEDYQRLLDAQQNVDVPAIELSRKALTNRLKLEAKSIQQKYINPPQTTDFAIMYLPSEGLYVEALNTPELQQQLQHDYHVTISGPSALYAFLSSLQMGFRTLAIESKSSEIWKMLGAVKTEFGKYEKALEEVEKKIQEAGNKVMALGTRSRAVIKQMKTVEALDETASDELLELDSD
ncbi:MAG: DNA recombination protein RmuC [Negativicutes bacterium]|jgi:DNA recombination protein RmuC